MAKVKVFEAATEGFRLIRREPKAVMVWSVALFVIMGIPAIFYAQKLAPMFQTFGDAIDGQSSEQMLGAMGGLFALMPLLYLLMIVGYSIVGGAVLRAVISPLDRRHFYLRASKAELWLALSAVAGIILGYIASFLIMLVLGIVVLLPLSFLAVALGWDPDANGPTWPIHAAMAVIEIAVGYLWLRFSMAPLMSFDERRFRLFSSWRSTQREGWRLVGLVLVLILALLLLEAVIVAVAFSSFGATLLRAMQDPAAAGELMRQMGAFYASPALWAVMAVGYLLAGPFMALFIAPWARVYLMLKGDAPTGADAAESQA